MVHKHVKKRSRFQYSDGVLAATLALFCCLGVRLGIVGIRSNCSAIDTASSNKASHTIGSFLSAFSCEITTRHSSVAATISQVGSWRKKRRMCSQTTRPIMNSNPTAISQIDEVPLCHHFGWKDIQDIQVSALPQAKHFWRSSVRRNDLSILFRREFSILFSSALPLEHGHHPVILIWKLLTAWQSSERQTHTLVQQPSSCEQLAPCRHERQPNLGKELYNVH